MQPSKRVLLALFVLLFPTLLLGQAKRRSTPAAKSTPPVVRPETDDLSAARNATDVFMKGIKLADLAEGREMLAEVQWITGEADHGENFYERPRYVEATAVYERLFDTDFPGVRGYKRVFDVKAVSKAGIPILTQLLIVAYKDRQSNVWKILGSNTGASIDLEKNVEYFREHLRDTRFVSEHQNYLTYGHWLLMAGRIKDARDALNAAVKGSTTPAEPLLAKSALPYADLELLQAQTLLNVIDRISPK